MPEKKVIAKFTKIELSKQIDTVAEFVDDINFKLGAARDPKKKRHWQTQLDWWASIFHSLNELKQMKF